MDPIRSTLPLVSVAYMTSNVLNEVLNIVPLTRVYNNKSVLSANDKRAQNGDAALLALGTPIYSIDGHSPFDKLAAIVEGEVWLFER